MARKAQAAQPADDDEDLVGGTAGDAADANARPNKTVEVGSAAARKLKSLIGRIEKLDGEAAGVKDDIKGIYREIKDAGYEVKVVRKLVSDRKKDAKVREEFEQLLDLYRHALGMAPAA